jgi:UDP-glucose 4-epimerase
MKVLVTGGAGFIGSHVVEACLAAGHRVLVVDDLSTGHAGNLPPGVPLEQVSITDAGAMAGVFEAFRPDVVSHHAAQISVRRSVSDPVHDAGVNILGLLVTAELALRHRVVRFVFASSGGAMYGEQNVFPAGEDHPSAPLSPYGVAKVAGEKYLEYYRAVHGLEYVALRYSNVYGPRQDPHGEAGVVAIFFQTLLEGRCPLINGDGLQTRDYIYVGDVAAANVAALGGVPSGGYNVGTGRESTVVELFEAIRGLAGSDCPAAHGPAKLGEQRRSCIDPGRFGRAAGWSPKVSLNDGLALTLEYFRGTRSTR